MGTRTLRAPSNDVTDDAEACLVMSYGQLLYMNGLLERADIDTMNALLGRKPGEVTQDSVIARLAYEAGIHEVEYSGAELEDLVNSYHAWKQCFADTGKELDPRIDYEQTWELWREFAGETVELRKEFARQFTAVPHYGTSEDLDHLISNGYGVIADVSNHNNGWAIYGLVLGGNSNDGYLVYHPIEGAEQFSAEQLFPRGKAELIGLRLPDGATGTPVTLPA